MCPPVYSVFADILVLDCTKNDIFDEKYQGRIPIFKILVSLSMLARGRDIDTVEELSLIPRSTCQTIFHKFLRNYCDRLFHHYVFFHKDQCFRNLWIHIRKWDLMIALGLLIVLMSCETKSLRGGRTSVLAKRSAPPWHFSV